MRKTIVLLLLAAMAITMLAGCGQPANPAPSTAAPAPSAPAPSAPAPSVPAPSVPAPSASAAPSLAPVVTASNAVIEGIDMNKKFVVGWSNCFTVAYGAAADRYIQNQFKRYPNVTLHMTNAQSNAAKQIADIEDLIAKGCQAIIVFPIDTSTLNNLLKSAVESGIVIVEVQRKISEDIGYFVGPDFSIVGETVAKHFTGMFPNGFKFCWLLGETGNATNIEAKAGFDRYIKEHNLTDKVIQLDAKNSASSRAETKTITENWIQAYGDEIDVIVGGNDETAMGAIAALEEAHMSDKVKVSGTAGTQEIFRYMKNGPCTLTFAVSTGAFPAVEMTLDILSGHADRYKNIYRIPMSPITPENVADYYDMVVGTDLYMVGELQPKVNPVFKNIAALFPEFVPLMEQIPDL